MRPIGVLPIGVVDQIIIGFSLVPDSAAQLATLVQYATQESFSLTAPVYIDIAPEVYEQLPSHITPEPWVAVPY